MIPSYNKIIISLLLFVAFASHSADEPEAHNEPDYSIREELDRLSIDNPLTETSSPAIPGDIISNSIVPFLDPTDASSRRTLLAIPVLNRSLQRTVNRDEYPQLELARMLEGRRRAQTILNRHVNLRSLVRDIWSKDAYHDFRVLRINPTRLTLPAGATTVTEAFNNGRNLYLVRDARGRFIPQFLSRSAIEFAEDLDPVFFSAHVRAHCHLRYPAGFLKLMIFPHSTRRQGLTGFRDPIDRSLNPVLHGANNLAEFRLIQFYEVTNLSNELRDEIDQYFVQVSTRTRQSHAKMLRLGTYLNGFLQRLLLNNPR